MRHQPCPERVSRRQGVAWAAVKAVASAMSTYRTLAKELLQEGHEGRRELLFTLLYDLIREPDNGAGLLARRTTLESGA